MTTCAATVRGRRPLSAHLVTLTLDVEVSGTGIPDEYVRVQIGQESRVYTISDLRIIDGATQIDLDIALHDNGVGADWARTCEPGDQVELVEPHGLYAAPAGVAWQLLVADITGLPALARILRGLDPGQRVEAVVVLTDEADRIALPSPADVDVTWVQVEHDGLISEALSSVVLDADLPDTDRYVWLAGEARASRTVRKHLRRTLGWPQADFYSCGYWQLDAELWNARFEQVADQVIADAVAAQHDNADDVGAYLDALEDIYDRAGL